MKNYPVLFGLFSLSPLQRIPIRPAGYKRNPSKIFVESPHPYSWEFNPSPKAIPSRNKALLRENGGYNKNLFSHDLHLICLIFTRTWDLGKWSNLTNIFQRGWNHQLEKEWHSQGGWIQKNGQFLRENQVPSSRWMCRSWVWWRRRARWSLPNMRRWPIILILGCKVWANWCFWSLGLYNKVYTTGDLEGLHQMDVSENRGISPPQIIH